MTPLYAATLVALVLLRYKSAVLALPDCTSSPLKSNKICDVTASPASRAAALVDAMQTQEKLDNLVRYGPMEVGAAAHKYT